MINKLPLFGIFGLIAGQRSRRSTKSFCLSQRKGKLGQRNARKVELLFRVTRILVSSLGTRPRRKRDAAASSSRDVDTRVFLFPRRVPRILDEDGEIARMIPGIGTSLTRKKTPTDLLLQHSRNEKPRKAMASDEARSDLPIRRQRGWQTPARLDSLRLDSTQLSTLCSHSIKNSPPLSWLSDALAYNAGAFFPLVTFQPYHRLPQPTLTSIVVTCCLRKWT